MLVLRLGSCGYVGLLAGLVWICEVVSLCLRILDWFVVRLVGSCGMSLPGLVG